MVSARQKRRFRVVRLHCFSSASEVPGAGLHSRPFHWVLFLFAYTGTYIIFDFSVVRLIMSSLMHTANSRALSAVVVIMLLVCFGPTNEPLRYYYGDE